MVTSSVADPIDSTPVVLARPESAQPTRRTQAFGTPCWNVLRDGLPPARELL
jgi:hypothetical protein